MTIIILASILISILFAPLGCILLWQRQSYFADGLAHACLLASSLSIVLDLPIIVTAPITAILFVVLLLITGLKNNNASINLVSSFMLGGGILLSSTFPNKVNLNTLLLGDILSVNIDDIFFFIFLIIIVWVVLWKKLDHIVLISLNEDLASAMGINGKSIKLYILMVLAIALSVSMKIIGALLASTILILPGFTASKIAKTPVQTLVFSVIISIFVSIIGIIASFSFDLPTTPSIIFCYGLTHFFVLFTRHLRLS